MMPIAGVDLKRINKRPDMTDLTIRPDDQNPCMIAYAGASDGLVFAVLRETVTDAAVVERLVACVNFCAGVPTGDLVKLSQEQSPLAEILDDLSYLPVWDETVTLQEQPAECIGDGPFAGDAD